MQGVKMKQKILLLSANDLSSSELSGSSKKYAILLSDGCAQFDDQRSVDAAGMHLILSSAMWAAIFLLLLIRMLHVVH